MGAAQLNGFSSLARQYYLITFDDIFWCLHPCIVWLDRLSTKEALSGMSD